MLFQRGRHLPRFNVSMRCIPNRQKNSMTPCAESTEMCPVLTSFAAADSHIMSLVIIAAMLSSRDLGNDLAGDMVQMI
jgi:hypothetical protein